MAFGFLLQKGRVLRYDKQVGALLFKDATIIKFMFSAVLAGMVGVYALYDMGQARLLFMPTVLGRAITGGLVFGMGWGLIGYCPGTSLGALGEGRWDAAWGILGMLAGSAVFAQAYPWARDALFNLGNLGFITVPQVLGLNHWVVIAAFLGGAVALFAWMETRRRRKGHPRQWDGESPRSVDSAPYRKAYREKVEV